MYTADINIQKARLLLQQGRYSDAEKEIGIALSEDPDNDEALVLLARVKVDCNDCKAALELLSRALHLNPENDYYIYLRAFAHYKLSMHGKAKRDLDEVIAINPYNANYFSLYAFVLMEERSFEPALQKADEGLRLDPENIGCLNARSRALSKLNRVGDAIETMNSSLAADPNNDWTHVSIGINYLEKGNHIKAGTHFKEALRLNPSNASAKSGLKEALKSSIAPYRWFMRFGVWMADKNKYARIVLAVGLFICFRIFIRAGESLTPPFNYLAYGFVGLYISIVLFSWLIVPIGNLFLGFHPLGKYALSVTEKITGKSVIAAVLVGIVCLGFALFFHKDKPVFFKLMIAAVTSVSLALPLGQMKYPLKNGITSNRTWITAAICGLGILGLLCLILNYKVGILFIAFFGIALLINTWASILTLPRRE